MSRKLWCITDGISLLDVFISKNEAEKELENLRDEVDDPMLYEIGMDELEDYPEECDLAAEKGYI